MPQSKEIQEQMRNKVIDIYQSGKGYKAICKSLELQWETLSTNGENMEQWWIFPGLAGLPKVLQESIDNSSRETSKVLQAALASVKICVHDSTIRKRLGKNGIHGRVPRRKPLLTKRNTKARLTFAKNHLDDFCIKKICGQTRQKWNFLGVAHLGESGAKLTQQFRKRTSYHQSNMLIVVLWSRCCFRTWMTYCNWWSHGFCSLPENPEGECLAISLWPYGQAHLDF